MEVVDIFTPDRMPLGYKDSKLLLDLQSKLQNQKMFADIAAS